MSAGLPTDTSNPELEAKISSLRVELKAFEHSFLREHKRKPTDADIKAHSIAAVYKDYHKQLKKQKYWLKEVASRSDKSHPIHQSTSTSSSNKTLPTISEPPPPPTPNRSQPAPSTPNKHTTPKHRRTSNAPWDDSHHDNIFDSPSSARRIRLFGNRATRDGIGPTPQKTGKVLGIFDSFTDITSTPTKSPAAGLPLTTNTPDGGVFLASPSKRNVQRVSQSPCTSDGSFTTPRKRKRGMVDGLPNNPGLQTPAALRTPSALRQRVMADDSLLMSPPAFRPPPKLKRGLSSLVAELREMEEHAHDDDEEAMREMEMEAAGIPVPPSKPKAGKKEKAKKDVDGFDRDLDLPELPPGAWQEEEVRDEAEVQVEGRTWKKKGLKRQTKRVKMRPVAVLKSKAAGTTPNTVEEEESEYESEYSDDDVDTPAATAPTKPSPAPTVRSTRATRPRGILQQAAEAHDDEPGEEAPEDEEAEPEEDYSSSGSEFAGDNDDQEDDEAAGKPAKLTKQATNQDVAALRNKERKKTLAEKSKDAAKKVARKVSATAHSHMNFQRLKIKGKNSGGRASGRFGKRR